MNYIPNINCNDYTPSDHCISFERNNLKIPMKVSGTFSYFYSQLPYVKELQEREKVFITLDSGDWNPHCGYFEKYENEMTNFEVEIV